LGKGKDPGPAPVFRVVKSRVLSNYGGGKYPGKMPCRAVADINTHMALVHPLYSLRYEPPDIHRIQAHSQKDFHLPSQKQWRAKKYWLHMFLYSVRFQKNELKLGMWFSFRI